MNRQEVLHLIQRMTTHEPILVGESNADKDSWKAYREAEEVCDSALNSICLEFIDEKTLEIDELGVLYHIFIFNCYNLQLGWKIIFDSLPKHPDTKIFEGILLQVSNINVTPEYRTWLVEDENAVSMILAHSRLEHSWERSRAWGALAYVSVLKDVVEERAIEALANYDEGEYEENIFLEAEQILNVIAKIGTKKSLPVLKSTMEIYKGKQWISSAAWSIGTIGKQDEEDYLLEQLEVQRNSFVKSVIALKITEYGSEKSIPAIIDKAKKLISKKRNIDGHFMENHWFELIDLLAFLKKYEGLESIENLFKWICSKNLDKLAPKELEWVECNLLGK